MSANSDNDLLDTSNMNKSLANNQNKIQVATEFYDELHSILNSKPPVSKEKVNKVIREALKSHRYYKHVVYYVENFIKNCPAEYKLSGLYVIDALIRKQNSNANSIEKKKHQAHIDLYTKRFSINICKTFNNLFLKSPQSDRCKINRVIELWQKYNVIENDLIDKLNRISNTSKIDIALSEKPINNSVEKNLNETFLNELEKLNQSVSNNGSSAKKLKPSSSMNKITTKTEISKILEFDKDFDSDSDNQSTLKRKSTSPHLVETTNPTSIFQSTAERLQNSISSCTAWLETNSGKSIEDQQIKLADFVPPAYLSTYHSSYVNSGNLPPPPPPPAPVPPPPTQNIKTDSKISPREREKERQRRGLPILKDKHLCICSKTIWLGHLSKSTNEDNVIDEITDLLSPSSSSNDSEFNSNKKRSSSRSTNGQNIIVDVHLIPPRGCAFVEFFDRKTASKCLDKMRDNYRLDGNYIKVAWAANRGIEKEKRLKEFWNVDVGCAYIPWEYLDSISKDLVDFSKWAIGGIVDEDSLPDKYLNVYKNQMVKISNSDPANSTKITEDESKNKSNDMEICTDDNQNDQSKQADLLPTSMPPMHYQNILNSQHMLPINFSTPPPNLGQQANVPQPNQFLNSNSSLAQNQIGLSSIQVHPINYQAINQLNSVFPSTDSNHESLVPPNQNLIDLLNSQRNLMPMPNFPPAPSQFQFFHRPVLMNPNNQNQFPPLGNQSLPQMRKILLPFHGMQSQMDKNEPPINQETSEISSTTQNEEKNVKTSESRNGSFRKNNWKSNNNHNNYNKRRSYGNDYNRNSYINNNRYSNQSNNFRNYNNNNGHNLDRK